MTRFQSPVASFEGRIRFYVSACRDTKCKRRDNFKFCPRRSLNFATKQKSKKDGRFEVIVGKSLTAEGKLKCFGLVNSYDTKPKRRVFEVLKSQGMQMNQQITFLSDGGDTVRELHLYLNPQAEHLLDWFHISMRLTVMNQMAKGPSPEESESPAGTLKRLESIKWYLWHGNVFKALQRIEHLEMELED